MKRIQLNQTSYYSAPVMWMATSTRYRLSAYGRTVAEAKQRLFLTVWAEKNNMLAYFWSEEVDIRPRVWGGILRRGCGCGVRLPAV